MDAFTCDLCHNDIPLEQMCRDETILELGRVICTSCEPALRTRLAQKVHQLEAQAGIREEAHPVRVQGIPPEQLFRLPPALDRRRVPGARTPKQQQGQPPRQRRVRLEDQAITFTDVNWTQCIAQFFQHLFMFSQSKHTVKGYKTICRQFFSDPDKSPATYTHAEAERYVQSLTAQGNSPSANTRNRRIAVLSSFYKFAATYTVAGPDGQAMPLFQGTNPANGIPFAEVIWNPKGIDEDEIEAFFAVIPNDIEGLLYRCVFTFYLMTAKRRSEILRLTWGDIERTMYGKGKDRRDGHRFKFTGKGHGSGSAAQYAELPQVCYDALIRYLEASERLATIQPEDPLFVAPHINQPTYHYSEHQLRPIGGDTVARALKKYAALAGISHMTIHTWRHTSAQQRYLQNPNLLVVQRALGHKSAETTRRYLEGLFTPDDPGARLLEKRFGHLINGSNGDNHTP